MTQHDERDATRCTMGSRHHHEKQRPDARVEHDKKRDWIVKHKDEFPNRLRTKIEAARGVSSSSSSSSSSQKFLSSIRLDLEELVFASNGTEGLNDKIDTEQQVELALRCFPEVLTSRRLGLYPIFWLARSIHSVSFIPLFAQLGEELALFQDFERGGLVFGGKYLTVFSQLAAGTTDAHLQHHRYDVPTTTTTDDDDDDDDDSHHHCLVDERFLSVLKRLRESKLMKRKDIQTNDLLGTLHQQVVFPELRFRYLVDWDPRNTLLKANGTALSWDLVSKCILDSEALSRCGDCESRDTAGIEMLFELAVTYFPIETGFLFHQYDVKRKRHQRGAMDDANLHKRRCRKYTLSRGSSPPREDHRTPPASTSGGTSTTVAAATSSKKAAKKTLMPTTTTITKTTTPYRIACEKFGIERANAILRDALDRNAGISDHCSALVYAASEPRVDLDCVYILLQRNPAFCKVQ